MAEPGAAPTGDEKPRELVFDEEREVSLDEAISIAMMFQKHGYLDDAERVYRVVLEAAPEHPVALQFSGVLEHQRGHHDEALALIGRSLDADPAQPDWHSNLGIVLRAQGKFEEAKAAFERAIALDPTHANARANLGTVLKAQGRVEEAEAAYREAIRLNPKHLEAYHNLGNLLVATGRTIEGVECLHRVTVLCPEQKDTRRLLALAHSALGELDKAADIYRRWLQDEPDNPTARHLLAACSGEAVPERAEDEYVEALFDNFASSFDMRLAHLAYRAPQLLAAALDEAGIAATVSLDILDVGCGTGLCGPLVRPRARRLVGVDLSEKMLAEARKRNVYDDLNKGELTQYLTRSAGAFDVIISADTLCYFGNLGDVISAGAAALRAGGWFVFTLEAAPDDRPLPLGYELQPSGRYAHSREYVDGLLRGAGLRVAIVPADLRLESGRPVAGFVVRANKGTAENGGS